MNRTLVTLLLLTIALTSRVSAAIIDSNDLSLTAYQSADGKNISTDSFGNEWLDISTTTGISYNSMNELLNGGNLDSFQFATLDQVEAFFNELGIPTAFPLDLQTPDPGGVVFSAASAHTGLTDNASFKLVLGLVHSPLQPAATTAHFGFGPGLDIIYTDGDYNASSFDNSNIHKGSWIFRVASIPEPSSIIVWGCLAAICLAVRATKGLGASA